MATTIVDDPNDREASFTNSGVLTAAELIATLSAPAFNILRTSSGVRMPPPIVNGMNISFATFLASSTAVSRFSWRAVMSRKTRSSAPSSL
jgi:hypothetical protein